MVPTSLDYALAFAAQNFHLFPCRHTDDPTDKRPCIEGWRQQATTDEKQIRAWAVQFPNCRWGVECEKSGLFIVDSDLKPGKNGEDSLAFLQAANGKLPETYTVRTKSGGVHRYFRGAGKNAANNLGPALDTRSVGGYAVIPDGQEYRPLNNSPIAAAPQWLLDKAGRPATHERPADADTPAPGVELDKHERLLDAIHYAQHDAPGAPVGTRDDTAYKVACQVRDFGLTYPAALKVMQEFWATRADVELTSDFGLAEVRWKTEQAYKTARSKLGSSLPEAAFANIPAQGGLLAFDAGDIDARLIPKRQWLLGVWLIKKFLTVTVAPGGTGKSNLSILEALSIATNRELSGDYVHEKGHVWLHNGEDPLDETARRISAACHVHKIKAHELKGRFFYTSGRTSPIKLVRELNRQLTIDQIAVDAVKKFITDHAILLWVVDPFVDMHEADENDNRAINLVAKVLSGIADETGCSIHVVHHTRKRGKDGGTTDMDAARGASALLAAARIGRNLNTMSAKDAKKFFLVKAPHWYVRLDSSKANLSSPTDATQWYERVSVELENGDAVGTLKPVELERIGSGNENDMLRQKAIDLVEQGGGSLSINQVCTGMEQDADVGLTRNALRDRLVKIIFARPYQTAEGVTYEVIYPAGGARNGIKLERVGPAVLAK